MTKRSKEEITMSKSATKQTKTAKTTKAVEVSAEVQHDQAVEVSATAKAPNKVAQLVMESSKALSPEVLAGIPLEKTKAPKKEKVKVERNVKAPHIRAAIIETFGGTQGRRYEGGDLKPFTGETPQQVKTRLATEFGVTENTIHTMYYKLKLEVTEADRAARIAQQAQQA